MPSSLRAILALVVGLTSVVCLSAENASPEQRAIDYLAAEVPRWSGENGCFSCHNDGDGMRALLFARRHGLKVSDDVLEPSLTWLQRPEDWSTQQGSEDVSDKHLARIQFAAAVGSSDVFDSEIRDAAARLVAADQQADGSWTIENETAAGSPVTYGSPLATALMLGLLERVSNEEYSGPVERARAWLLSQDSATLPLRVAVAISHHADNQVFDSATAKIVAAQNGDGGWGPYPNSPSECFDTALALVALSRASDVDRPLASGRQYLVGRQLDSGGWPETTRPTGGDSYAQHVSTTAWAAMALIASR